LADSEKEFVPPQPIVDRILTAARRLSTGRASRALDRRMVGAGPRNRSRAQSGPTGALSSWQWSGSATRPFQRAFSQALLSLSDRERMVYRLHIVDGLTVKRIAKTYGVSRSTVSRWMASARSNVVAEVQRLLRDELRASAEDYKSLSRLLVSQLDLSVSRLLRKSL
jgi:DNA-directed RNA polymerase specialized sigma24 family protein